MDNKEQKEIFKQAVKEWMDENYLKVGKYTVNAIGVLIVAGLIYFLLWTQGYVHK